MRLFSTKSWVGILFYLVGCVMHISTTDLAKETLAHAKELIKELDEAKYSYDRQGLVTLLASFTEAYKNRQEWVTVAHLEEIIAQLERIDHTYHERLLEQQNKGNDQEMNVLLSDFKQETFAQPSTSWFHTYISSKSFFARIYDGLSWIESVLLWIVLLFGVLLLFVGVEHYLWYVLIMFSLCSLAVLLVRWSWTLWGRVVVLALLCSVVWVWASIV